MSSIDKHNPARHTPGPWRIGPTQDEGNGIQSVAILAGEGPTLWGVAKLGIVDTLRDAGTQTANAILIVEAPNMAATLRSVKEWLEMLHALHQSKPDRRTEWPMPGMGARYREVCEALQKAEGRT